MTGCAFLKANASTSCTEQTKRTSGNMDTICSDFRTNLIKKDLTKIVLSSGQSKPNRYLHETCLRIGLGSPCEHSNDSLSVFKNKQLSMTHKWQTCENHDRFCGDTITTRARLRMTIAALATLTLVVLHSSTGFNVLQGAFKSLGRQRHDKIISFPKVVLCQASTWQRHCEQLPRKTPGWPGNKQPCGRMNESISQTTKLVYSLKVKNLSAEEGWDKNILE